jgi:hypothetical protein
MTLKHDPVTSSGKSAPGTDPRIRHRIQIDMFRPIRVDHTNCLQVDIKTHSFMRNLHDVVYTGFLGELEHLKIKTRLIDEMFVSVMGEYLL